MAADASAGDGEAELNATINTTPLVDIMLVILIIFLITVPVVTHSVPVALPNEYDQPTKVRSNNVVIAVDRDGNLYFTELRAQKIYKLGTDGEVTVFRENSHAANGLVIDSQGRLIPGPASSTTGLAAGDDE